MPTPEPDRRAAVRPRNEVSAVWRMRTMRRHAAALSIAARSCACRSSESGMPPSVRKSFVPKAGRDADHHFRGAPGAGLRPDRIARCAASPAPRAGRTPPPAASTVSRSSTSRIALIAWRALRIEPVAGAGPAIVVRVVDGADHAAVADDGGGLQVVAGDAQLDSDRRFSASSRKPRLASALITSTTVMPRALIASRDEGDVARHVAFGVVRAGGGERRSPSWRRVGLPSSSSSNTAGDRIEGAPAQVERASLQDRRQAAIGLEIALQHQIILQLLAVQKRRVEGIVVFQDRPEARADEVRAGDQVGQDLGADADLRFASTARRCRRRIRGRARRRAGSPPSARARRREPWRSPARRRCRRSACPARPCRAAGRGSALRDRAATSIHGNPSGARSRRPRCSAS